MRFPMTHEAPQTTDAAADRSAKSATTASEPIRAGQPLLQVTRSEGAPSSPAQWDEAVRYSRYAWLYHLSPIVPLVTPPRTEPPIFIECRHEGRLAGGAILVVTRYKWHNLIERRILKTYLGPLQVPPFVIQGLNAKLTEAVLGRVIEACEELAEELHCDDLVLCDAPASTRCLDDRPLVNQYVVSNQWEPLMEYHYILDLRLDSEALLMKMEASRRKQLRRPGAGLDVVAAKDLSDAYRHHVDLIEAVYRRENIELVSRDRLEQVWEEIYCKDAGQAFFCLDHGKPCAVTGVTRFGNSAAYFLTGRTDDSPRGAVALALWASILWAKAAGCTWFDCNTGVFEKTGRDRARSIGEFKRSFGGDIFLVHGARRRFRPLARATYDFIDAWGARAKQTFQKLNPFRK